MTYELMVLADASVDLTSEKTQKDFVKRLIGDNAEITKIESLGKKALAYDIAKKSEATYLVAELSGTLKSAEIDKKAKLTDEVLRFLLTAKE